MPLDQDLLAVLLTTGLAAGLVAAPAGLLRVAAALPLAIFLPGYALLAALYPGRTDMSAFERIVLSVVMSLTLVIAAGLALSATSWGLSVAPISTTLTVFVVAGAGAAWQRRRRLPAEERFTPTLRAVNMAVAVCVLLGVVAAGFGLAALRALDDTATQFYLLGPNGKLEGYPTSAAVGRPVDVTLGIANRGTHAATYRVVVSDGRSTLAAYEMPVGPKSSVERRVSFTPIRSGRTDVTFLLYKPAESRARQFLRLPLTVAP